MYRPTWVEIDMAKLRHNIGVIRAGLAPGAKLMAVVKADAYGHGMEKIAKQALECGAQMLCVAIPEEGIALRRSGINAPVLVMGAVNFAGMNASVEHGLIQTVFDTEAIGWADEAASLLETVAQVDLKIDTGMNRIGAKGEEAVRAVLDALKISKNVALHGCYTHYAVSEEDDAFTRLQYERFSELAEAVKREFPGIMLHSANSGGALLHKYLHADGVRCGIAMYGSAPGPDMQTDLQPVMSWKTRIVQVKELAQGETVSYGRTYSADRAISVATLPVGYGDGFKRCLSNRAWVLVGGKRAPVVGRVCMDQIIVDVTGIDAASGDEAVLIGRQGGEEITPWEMAAWAETIPYEITLAVTARVPKIYLNEKS